MAIPYIFGNQTGIVPLSELDSNFSYVGGSSGVTYTPTGTGAVATTVQAKLRQTVSVLDFGATGNGTTDDTTSFQNAVNAAIGGRLIVPPGTYKLGTISLLSNSEYDFGEAIFYPTAATSDTWLFQVVGKTNVKIRGGVFSIASYTPAGTYVPAYSTVGTSWANGYFYGGTGIYINSGCTFIEVSGCKFNGYLGSVNVYDSSYVSVHDTTSYNGLAGLSAVANAASSNMTGIQFTNNTIVGCGDDGIALLVRNSSGTASISSSVVSGNYIDKTRLFATAVLSAVGIRLANISVTPAGSIINCVVSNNTLRNVITHGLFIHNTINCSITNNLIDGFGASSSPAFQLGVAATTNITGLTFTNNECRGQVIANKCIDANYIATSTISNNVLIGGNGDSIIGGLNIIQCCFTGNQFVSAVGPAFRLTGTSDYNVIVGNNVTQSNDPWIVTTGTYSRVGNNVGQLLKDFQTPAQAGTVTPNVLRNTCLQIACTSTMTSFTVGLSTNTVPDGQPFTIVVRNQTVSTAVTTTWVAGYKLATWGSLANGFTRTITFLWDGGNSVWTEASRSSDIAN